MIRLLFARLPKLRQIQFVDKIPFGPFHSHIPSTSTDDQARRCVLRSFGDHSLKVYIIRIFTYPFDRAATWIDIGLYKTKILTDEVLEVLYDMTPGLAGWSESARDGDLPGGWEEYLDLEY